MRHSIQMSLTSKNGVGACGDDYAETTGQPEDEKAQHDYYHDDLVKERHGVHATARCWNQRRRLHDVNSREDRWAIEIVLNGEMEGHLSDSRKGRSF